MSRILPLDELNVLIRKYNSSSPDTPISRLYDLDDIIDDLLDLFLLAIANGVVSINEQFGADYQPDAKQIEEVVYKKIDGLTWKDRVTDWYNNGGTGYDIARIAETEAHRIGNDMAFQAAKAAGATEKKWICQLIPTSRDSHVYLHGTKVGINDYFYSYKGGKTLYPGEFGIADEDINCLCELEFK